ncbi:lytic murein transglycosylase [Mangrovicella endophytica]|uniref:lytic murein transglycosylase n=1 Tax=Mangrovicella endophytica TaxID=2066697 RepID=UPI000C9E020E|nr:lytic murein transglycosylase [Mangrovicella endophytica]
MRMILRAATIAMAVVLAMLPLASRPAFADDAAIRKGFRAFLEADIWPDARKRGVPRAIFDAAFDGVSPNLKLPDLQLPGQPETVEEVNFQAEFKSPAAYFDEAQLKRLSAKGRTLLAENKRVLSRIEAAYGVPAPIIVAIWGRESGFGAAKIPNNAFEVLGTKAYLSRRKAMFREELLAALEIVADGHLRVSDMRSSWAGALGQPQFMPSKFLKLAVDFDGDGRKDIWRSVPDTLASIANYLRQAGWTPGRDWGFEANLPESVSCALEGPDRGQPISAFVDTGVRRVSGKAFPAAELKAKGHLMLPEGRLGPTFVVTPNFYVLKDYNNSDLYALFIGHLADRMSGGTGFAGRWTKTEGLTRGDVARLQRKLEAMGSDVGGADGLPGFKTRRSIGLAEEKQGLDVTCWPSKSLLRALR